MNASFLPFQFLNLPPKVPPISLATPSVETIHTAHTPYFGGIGQRGHQSTETALDQAAQTIRFNASRWSRRTCRQCFNTALASVRCHGSLFSALRDAAAFPSMDVGPVDFSHGFQLRISSACRALRSGVQPFAMMLLQ